MSKTTQLSFPAADPFILRAVDGRYYLYCTSEDGSGIPIHVSDDLVHWQRCGTAIGKDTARWGVDCFWAPECYEINGKYYLFYSADWKENPTGALENFRIGVAVADDPAGPFADMADKPIFDPGYPIIDADVYTEDGRYYLYYSRCCYEHNVDGLEESWIGAGVGGAQRCRHRPPLERGFVSPEAQQKILHDLLRQFLCRAGLRRWLRYG